jgi:hypothetical protein
MNERTCALPQKFRCFVPVSQLEMYLRAGSLLLILATTAFLVAAAPEPVREFYDLVNEDVIVDPTTVSGITRITIHRLVNASWTLCDPAAARWDINPAPVHADASDHSIGMLGFEEPTGNFVNCRITVCGGRLGRIVAAATGGGLVNCSISIVDVVFVGASSADANSVLLAVDYDLSQLTALNIFNALFSSVLKVERCTFTGLATIGVRTIMSSVTDIITSNVFRNTWFPTSAHLQRFVDVPTTSVRVNITNCVFIDLNILTPPLRSLRLWFVDANSLVPLPYTVQGVTVLFQPLVQVTGNVFSNLSASCSNAMEPSSTASLYALALPLEGLGGVVRNNTMRIRAGAGYALIAIVYGCSGNASTWELSSNVIVLSPLSVDVPFDVTGIRSDITKCDVFTAERNDVRVEGVSRGFAIGINIVAGESARYSTITVRGNRLHSANGVQTMALFFGLSLSSSSTPSEILVEGNHLIAERIGAAAWEGDQVFCHGIYNDIPNIVSSNIGLLRIADNTIDVPRCDLHSSVSSASSGGAGISMNNPVPGTIIELVRNTIVIRDTPYAFAMMVCAAYANTTIRDNVMNVSATHVAVSLKDLFPGEDHPVVMLPMVPLRHQLRIENNSASMRVSDAFARFEVDGWCVVVFVCMDSMNWLALYIADNWAAVVDATPYNASKVALFDTDGPRVLHLSIDPSTLESVAAADGSAAVEVTGNSFSITTNVNQPSASTATTAIFIRHMHRLKVLIASNRLSIRAIPDSVSLPGSERTQCVTGVLFTGAFGNSPLLRIVNNSINILADTRCISGAKFEATDPTGGPASPTALVLAGNHIEIETSPSTSPIATILPIHCIFTSRWMASILNFTDNTVALRHAQDMVARIAGVYLEGTTGASLAFYRNNISISSNHTKVTPGASEDSTYGLVLSDAWTSQSSTPQAVDISGNRFYVWAPGTANVSAVSIFFAVSNYNQLTIANNTVTVTASRGYSNDLFTIRGIGLAVNSATNVSNIVVAGNVVEVSLESSASASKALVSRQDKRAVKIQNVMQGTEFTFAHNRVSFTIGRGTQTGSYYAVSLGNVVVGAVIAIANNAISLIIAERVPASALATSSDAASALRLDGVSSVNLTSNEVTATSRVPGEVGGVFKVSLFVDFALPIAEALSIACSGQSFTRLSNNVLHAGPDVTAIAMRFAGTNSACQMSSDGDRFEAIGNGTSRADTNTPAAVGMWLATSADVTMRNATFDVALRSSAARFAVGLAVENSAVGLQLITVHQSVFNISCDGAHTTCFGVYREFSPYTNFNVLSSAINVIASSGSNGTGIGPRITWGSNVMIRNSSIDITGTVAVGAIVSAFDFIALTDSRSTITVLLPPSTGAAAVSSGTVLLLAGVGVATISNCDLTVTSYAPGSEALFESTIAVMLLDRTRPANGEYTLASSRVTLRSLVVGQADVLPVQFPEVPADRIRSVRPRVRVGNAPTRLRAIVMRIGGQSGTGTFTIQDNTIRISVISANASGDWSTRLSLVECGTGVKVFMARNTANFTFGRQGIAPSVALDPIARRRYVDGALLIYDAATDAQLQAFVSLNRLDAVPSLPLMILGREDAACALSRRCASQRPQAMPPFNVTVSCNELGDRAADATDVVVVSGTAAGWNASTSASALAATGDLNVLNGVRVGVGLRMVPCSITSTRSRSRSLSSDESSTASYLPSRTASTVPSASQSLETSPTVSLTATVTASQSMSGSLTTTHSTSPTLTPPRTPTPSLTTSISATQVPAVMAAVDTATGRDTLRGGGGWFVLNGLAGPAVMGFNVTLLGGEDGQRAVTESFAAGGCEAVVALEAQADILTAFTAAADADRVPELSAEVGTPNATSRASLIRTASASEATASVITRHRSQHRDALTALLTPLFTSEEDVWTSTQASKYRLVDMTARVVTTSQPAVTNAFVAFSPMIVDDSVNSGANATGEQLSRLTGRAFRLQITFPPTCFARRSGGVAMTTFVAFAPPAPPPPPPPQVVVPSAAVIVATISSGAGGAVGGAASAAIAARSNAILLLGSCEFDEAEDEQAKAEEARIERFSTGAQTGPEDSAGDNVADGDVDVVDGPLRLRVLGSNAVGAGVGNAILLLALTVLHAVAARARLWMRQRSGESLPSQVTTGLAGLDVAMVRWPWLRFAALSGSLARLPSLESVAFMFLLGPTVSLLVACLAAPAPSEASASAVSGQTAVALAVLLLFAALSVAVGAVVIRDPFPAVFLREEHHLPATSCARHSVRQRLESFLRGAGEWEDRTTRRDAAEDALRSAALGGKRCKAAHFSFVRAFGLMFIDYLPERRWWLVVEVATTWAVSIVDGLIKAGYCGAGQGWALAVIMTANVAATMVFRPLEAYHNHVFTVTLSGAQALATVSLATALSLRNNNATVTSAGAAAARTLFRISEMVMLMVTILTTLRMVYDGARAAAAMISSRYKRARLRYSMEQAVAVGIVTDSADAELDRLLMIPLPPEHENMGGLLVPSNTQHPQRTDESVVSLRSPTNASVLQQPLLHETRQSSDTQRLLERSLDLLDDLERQMEHLRDSIQRTTALEREVALREGLLRRGYL